MNYSYFIYVYSIYSIPCSEAKWCNYVPREKGTDFRINNRSHAFNATIRKRENMKPLVSQIIILLLACIQTCVAHVSPSQVSTCSLTPPSSQAKQRLWRPNKERINHKRLRYKQRNTCARHREPHLLRGTCGGRGDVSVSYLRIRDLGEHGGPALRQQHCSPAPQ